MMYIKLRKPSYSGDSASDISMLLDFEVPVASQYLFIFIRRSKDSKFYKIGALKGFKGGFRPKALNRDLCPMGALSCVSMV